jgi:hypothetical protein
MAFYQFLNCLLLRTIADADQDQHTGTKEPTMQCCEPAACHVVHWNTMLQQSLNDMDLQ